MKQHCCVYLLVGRSVRLVRDFQKGDGDGDVDYLALFWSPFVIICSFFMMV